MAQGFPIMQILSNIWANLARALRGKRDLMNIYSKKQTLKMMIICGDYQDILTTHLATSLNILL